MMQMISSYRESNTCVGGQRGQSLILALLIMFLLVFIGGLFITIIARNVSRTARAGDILTSEYLADAGVRYADDQLTYSSDGADWRPLPSYPKVVAFLSDNPNATDGDIVTAVKALPTYADGDLPVESDPDYMFLLHGYTRYSYGNGRFLVKISYNPTPGDPVSKYIKIDSVGRVGVVDANDPTTWAISQPMHARREKVAYKAIGITDYARFITNKDRRPGELALGTPGFVTNFGVYEDTDKDGTIDRSKGDTASGGSIRVNGNLLWHGKNFIWIDPMKKGEGIEVAGDIRQEIYDEKDHTTPSNPTKNVMVNDVQVLPSTSPDFTTNPGGIVPSPTSEGTSPNAGCYRDGRMDPDVNGWPRAIFRLDPPLIDAGGPSGTVGRYRNLSRNSGDWKNVDDKGKTVPWYNTGYYGWGDGLYVDNHEDIQTESTIYTLRGDWTNPGNSDFWQGPYYTPPAVSIILTSSDLDGDGFPDMILTHENPNSRAKFIWHDRFGNLMTGGGEQIIMPYPKNGVIFCEGNIRIKGTLPEAKTYTGLGDRKGETLTTGQITVVSGGTIYIDGNILKNRMVDDKGPILETDGTQRIDQKSSIALLATDNVCVNTTQFFGPVRGVPQNGNNAGQEQNFEVSPGNEGTFWFDFASGKKLHDNAALYVRHTSEGGSEAGYSYINMLINQSSADRTLPWFGVYPFGDPKRFALPQSRPSQPLSQYLYAYALDQANTTLPGSPPVQYSREAVSAPVYELAVFPLKPLKDTEYEWFTDVGVYNRIGFQFDQSITDTSLTKVNYLLSRAAVQPFDITIEALIYAQNGSFFVLPGLWFNPDQSDYEKFSPTGTRLPRPWYVADVRYPFYGQPLDVQIVIDGAVSENIPASASDVKSWMDKWGWIPDRHGSSSEVTTDYRGPLDPEVTPSDPRRQGLTFVYDPHMAYPREFPEDSNSTAIRKDAYGRLLPITPFLPVSPQTLYSGEPS